MGSAVELIGNLKRRPDHEGKIVARSNTLGRCADFSVCRTKNFLASACRSAFENFIGWNDLDAGAVGSFIIMALGRLLITERKETWLHENKIAVLARRSGVERLRNEWMLYAGRPPGS